VRLAFDNAGADFDQVRGAAARSFPTDSSFPTGSSSLGGGQAGFFPDVSITQDDDNLYLRAEVPGIHPEELSISAARNGVSLAGKRTLPREQGCPNGDTLRTEAFFDCTLSLPAEVDAERVDAGYCNGVLTLTLPKWHADEPKQTD
jgi:HSP20 family protein